MKMFKQFVNENIQTKSIHDFYLENNINPDDLQYLGNGDFGEAYSIGDGRVLKKHHLIMNLNWQKKWKIKIYQYYLQLLKYIKPIS